MSEPFIGQIMMFAGNFAPRGWALCSGQILPINQNVALFSIVGTTYAGNGQTTFALPDLRGRAPMHPGQGPGLSNRPLGEVGGTEVETLTIAQMPAHNHPGDPEQPGGGRGEPGRQRARTVARRHEHLPALARSGREAQPGIESPGVIVAGDGQPHRDAGPARVGHEAGQQPRREPRAADLGRPWRRKGCGCSHGAPDLTVTTGAASGSRRRPAA